MLKSSILGIKLSCKIEKRSLLLNSTKLQRHYSISKFSVNLNLRSLRDSALSKMHSVEDSTKPILLVEDESGDAELLMRAFKKAGVQNPIRHLDNGDAALFYLRETEVAASVIPNPMPVLILLDLKLPGMSGLELLRWLRQQKHLRRIPVLVLTSETDDKYMNAAYDAGANSYLLKSPKPEEVERVVNLITNYWLNLNESPLIVSRR